MEKIIQCPVCWNDHRCFEDEIEAEGTDFSSYLCFNCGFTSNSHYIKESVQRKKQLETTAQLVRDLEFEDTVRGIYWYPSVINMGKLGIIFPEGSTDYWMWKYAKVVEIPEEDREKYPIPDKEGQFYDTMLDVDNASTYGQYEFLEVCREMGIAKDIE